MATQQEIQNAVGAAAGFMLRAQAVSFAPALAAEVGERERIGQTLVAEQFADWGCVGVVLVTDEGVVFGTPRGAWRWARGTLVGANAFWDVRSDTGQGRWLYLTLFCWGSWLRLSGVKTDPHVVDAATAAIGEMSMGVSADVQANAMDMALQTAEFSRSASIAYRTTTRTWEAPRLRTPPTAPPPPPAPAPASAVPPPPPPTPSAPVGSVAVNAASEGELAPLPGVGPIVAKRIVALRSERAFASQEDFVQRLGLKPHEIARLAPLLSFAAGQPSPPSGGGGRVVDF